MPKGYRTIVPVGDIFTDIPDKDKTGLYYTIISVFIISTLATTLLSGAFLLLSFMLWTHLKKMKFFWFLTQLNITVFILSAVNLFVNVPATLHLLSKNVGTSTMYIFLIYLLDFCHYSILFSNTVIGLQRGFVFYFDPYAERVFNKPIIYVWLSVPWILPLLAEYFLFANSCAYEFDVYAHGIILKCQSIHRTTLSLYSSNPVEIQIVKVLGGKLKINRKFQIDSTLHIVMPTLLFWIYLAIIVKIIKTKRNPLNKNEILILKQAIFVFVAFQSSSLVLLSAQYFEITQVDAFLLKRFVNNMEILAGAATPAFFFFTSKEIRRLVTTRVTAYSSQTGSDVQVRVV